MRNIKYVVINHVFPVIFSEPLSHKDMTCHGTITSAGFLHFEKGELHCYGEALSLKSMRPAEHDAEIIKAFLERRFAGPKEVQP